MRRLTGTVDGVAYTLWEYSSGYVECPPALGKALARHDRSLPTGPALAAACLALFGDSLQIKEEP
jgi:hypothetical protein